MVAKEAAVEGFRVVQGFRGPGFIKSLDSQGSHIFVSCSVGHSRMFPES